MTIYEIRTRYVPVGRTKRPPEIRCPDAAAEYLRGAFDARREQEQLWVILLDNANRPLGRELITIGLVDMTPVHAREAFRFAVRENASAVVFAHNHPSGCTAPSKEDMQITRMLTAAGDILGIPVLDHVIIADGRCRSIRKYRPELFQPPSR
jgi:DNA repair protein RadC